MSLTSKVNATLLLAGKERADFAAHLGVTDGSLRTKQVRQSFSTGDLVKLCDFVGGRLVLELPDSQRVVITADDLKTPEKVKEE